MIAVTNSGPLITLAKLNQLRLLPVLYDSIVVPQAVYREAVTVGQARGYPDASVTDAFLKRMKWQPETPASVPAELGSGVRLGRGEREAIPSAFADRRRPCPVHR